MKLLPVFIISVAATADQGERERTIRDLRLYQQQINSTKKQVEAVLDAEHVHYRMTKNSKPFISQRLQQLYEQYIIQRQGSQQPVPPNNPPTS